jgi:hypothetical protein
MGFAAESREHRPMAGPPDKARLDELLDEALAETFPASDPVSLFSGDPEPPSREGEEEPDEQHVREDAVHEPGEHVRRRARPR